MRDYVELLAMPPKDLIQYALECVKLNTISATLVEVLAHQLEIEAAAAAEVEGLRDALEDAEDRADYWKAEAGDKMKNALEEAVRALQYHMSLLHD